jgi:hypothetical protein
VVAKHSALSVDGGQPREFTGKDMAKALRPVEGTYSRLRREGHYMVFGRLDGDDDDSVRTYHATCEAAAVCAFVADFDGSTDVPTYITYVDFTGEAIPCLTTVNTGAY